MKTLYLIATLLLVASCSSDKASQNLYTSREVGKAKRIIPCTVVATRDVVIREANSGNKGEAIGFFVGAVASADNNSNQPLVRYLGGLLGGAIGRSASDKLHERDGVEYTVLLSDGEERQLIQDIREGESILEQGDACRMQASGDLNRILPAGDYPEAVKRPVKTQFIE